MALKAAVGISDGEDAYIVGARAAQEATNTLGEHPISLVIVFASVAYDQQKVIEGVRSVTGKALLVGSSTAGEITSMGAAPRHSIAVMVISAETGTFVASVGTDVRTDPHHAGEYAATVLREQLGDALNACIMLSDPLTGNGADIVRGFQAILGKKFPIVGGSAGDDFRFEKTYQYLNNTVYSNAVVGVGIGGTIQMGIGVRHGWLPVGSPRIVTKAVGSILYELDGQPAIRIYEDYFGEAEADQLRRETLARLAVQYPLGMRAPDNENVLIRDPLTVDDTGAITCAAEIPEGSEIQLMLGDQDEALRLAEEAARDACMPLSQHNPEAIVVFDCISRSKLFAEHADDEINAIKSVVGKQTPLIGFYTYGEQAQMAGQLCSKDNCDTVFHNGTVVICALRETEK